MMTLVELSTHWIAIAVGMTVFAFIFCLVWIISVRLIGRRLRFQYLGAMPCELDINRRSPAQRIPAGRLRKPSQTTALRPIFLEPKSLYVEQVAVIDAIGALYLNSAWANKGASLAAELVGMIPKELTDAESALSLGMRHFAQSSHTLEDVIQGALPSEAWNWFQETGCVNLVHAIQDKADLLDSGHTLNFFPEGADTGIDLSCQFPWFTAILSSVREVRLLCRRDTTLEKALTHVCIDIVAVAGGAAVGSTVALAIATAIDITLTGGLLSAVTALFGVGGAVAGAKIAKMVKYAPLEKLSQQYSRQACYVNDCLHRIEEHSLKELEATYSDFEQREVALRSEIEMAWEAEVDSVRSEWEKTASEFGRSAIDMVRSKRLECHTRLMRVESSFRRRRWFIWIPSITNITLWESRGLLPKTISALDAAERELSQSHSQDINAIWTILLTATYNDPMSILAPRLADHANAERSYSYKLQCVNSKHRSIAASRFSALQEELDEEAARTAKWVRDNLSPPLERLRTIEDHLRREASALGARFR